MKTGLGNSGKSRLGPGFVIAFALLALTTVAGGVGVVNASGFTVSGVLGSGLCVLNGGVWVAGTCTISVDWTMKKGTALIIPPGVTLVSSGTISNYGRIGLRTGTLSKDRKSVV